MENVFERMWLDVEKDIMLIIQLNLVNLVQSSVKIENYLQLAVGLAGISLLITNLTGQSLNEFLLALLILIMIQRLIPDLLVIQFV